MNHPTFVRRGDSSAKLPGDLHGLVVRQAPDAPQQRRQRLTVDVFHREELAATGFPKVVEAADVLV